MAATVFVPEVNPEKGIVIVEVQVGATPVPPEIKNCPKVPADPPGLKAPDKVKFPDISKFPGPAAAEEVPNPREAATVAYVLTFKLPTTSSLAAGAVVPMPTLPELVAKLMAPGKEVCLKTTLS